MSAVPLRPAVRDKLRQIVDDALVGGASIDDIKRLIDQGVEQIDWVDRVITDLEHLHVDGEMTELILCEKRDLRRLILRHAPARIRW